MPLENLKKLAAYSAKLQEQANKNIQLESWVQAKIDNATDAIASVYHYLEYENNFQKYSKILESSGNLSEGQKSVLKARLSEAKAKVKELKKAQAEKIESKKVEEGILSGGEAPCDHCGGTGMIHKEPATIPHHVKGKVAAYNRKSKAMHAASKRLDKNHNGIPDEDELEEDQESLKKTGDSYTTSKGNRVTKTDTGLTHERPASSYSDEDGDEKSGKGTKSHAKSQSAAEKKERAPAQKMSPKSAKTWGMKDNEKFDNRDKMDEAKAKCCCEEKGKTKCPVHGKVEESKPSAGLSKEKKSAVVKKAKAGGDIGKPGKSFDKVAKAAGGGKKGEKIAAAAMWKNIKETTAYIEEKKAATKDLPGNQEKIDADHDGKIEKSDLAALRAGKKEKETVKESADLARMKQFLTRLNG
jgi:hypothetical protein